MEEKVLEMLVKITDEESIKQDININLFEKDILDSLGFTELIVCIDEEFNIEISPTEISREEIDTPAKIIEFIKNKSK